MKNLEINQQIEAFLKEDELFKNIQYIQKLPSHNVKCSLKIKDDLILAGLPYFEAAFNILDPKLELNLSEYEGKPYAKGSEINFDLPFNIALSGERIGLNLLQRASSIASFTNLFVKKLEGSGINLLDTRKTTPGLRSLEKYATQVGGAKNHRFSQLDAFMVKDNHKNYFGGIKGALEFFNNLNGFYTPLILEVHSKDEFLEASELGVKHIMLDNFSPTDVKEVIGYKKEFQTIEVSGGINLETIENYKINGVDAISVGSITYAAPAKDISLKYGK
tara:strand:- start:26986 stop:27813 length:828 start_codon:yes stop_codon:yes gene_type:complete